MSSGKPFEYDCLHQTNHAKKPYQETAKQAARSRGKKCRETFRPHCCNKKLSLHVTQKRPRDKSQTDIRPTNYSNNRDPISTLRETLQFDLIPAITSVSLGTATSIGWILNAGRMSNNTPKHENESVCVLLYIKQVLHAAIKRKQSLKS